METQTNYRANQKVVESLIMVCGKKGLALCGHHDDKLLWNEQDELDFENHGNFIELVSFRAETDEVLNKHLFRFPPKMHTAPQKSINLNIE